jgi:hypothetical protein
MNPQHQWASKLLGFDFRVEYKPSATNTVINALSQCDTEIQGAVAALSAPSFQVFDDISHEFDIDPALRTVKDEVSAGKHGDKWRVIDGLVTINDRVYVLPAFPSLPLIMASAHGVGQEGTMKMIHHLRADFFLPDKLAAVLHYVCACVVCQRNKTEQLHQAGLLQPLQVPSAV